MPATIIAAAMNIIAMAMPKNHAARNRPILSRTAQSYAMPLI
ncbi:hypothetical protein ABID19_006820 [Mesorhizobium robiniae]|uniref:Uncharacterized protein n=1 Tax=Mesorhizobium robiniae TaxID=559315 RepID=A0ABV2GZP1_9HYPH